MLVSINRLIDCIKQKPLQSPAGKDAQAKTSSMPPRASSASPNSETDHQKVIKLQTTSTSLSKSPEESMKNEVEDSETAVDRYVGVKEAEAKGKAKEAEAKPDKVNSKDGDKGDEVKESYSEAKGRKADEGDVIKIYKRSLKSKEMDSEAEPKGEGVKYSEAETKGEGVKYSEAEPKGEGVKYSEAEPKGEGVKYSEAEPKGEGFKYSEAESKGDGVKDSETAHKSNESVNNSEAKTKTNKVEDTVEEAQVLIRHFIALLAEGGFPIRKWVSNSPKILDFQPKDQKRISQSFDFMDLPPVKILGILWDPSLHSFTIRVRPPDIQVYSKRSLPSLIAKIYDPLGWMAPLVIIFKIMLQNLWAKGCNWDEKLPRYIPCRSSILTLELHGFCDSSEKAYAAVIYVKSCKHNGSVNMSLIASKTKVAPIKVLSLPRLELCSALLLANLFAAVKESLSLHFDQIFLWSDSTIALNWIKSESKRWKAFVANRVSAIQRKTPSHSWLHVPGSENPADLATRGLTPAQLIDNQLWWQGPHWLQDPSVKSYVDLHPSDELSPETLIEERSTILIEAILNSRPLLPLDSNFDSYEALTPSYVLNGSPLLAIPDEVVDNLSHISRWKCIQSMKNSFWKKWSQDYLNLLQARPRWHRTHQDLQYEQLVLLKQDSTPPHHWPLARIFKTYKGPDGHVRVVDLKTPKNVLKPPITKIAPLPFKE
ncbi:hypothetical protein LAZ67_4002868 [Cordylochernes scorpioides]|uniref:DUF5641 domain-containing protein n=1 Tax=Cordylochernes scorpioides TaxID=51811 RepID=A0ABY6KDB2_9ARAC|nr:hypothetical protein LAZ67_4002868 [Cordylochernes scorpioides]